MLQVVPEKSKMPGSIRQSNTELPKRMTLWQVEIPQLGNKLCSLEPEQNELLSNHEPIFLFNLKVERKLFLACGIRVWPSWLNSTWYFFIDLIPFWIISCIGRSYTYVEGKYNLDDWFIWLYWLFSHQYVTGTYDLQRLLLNFYKISE